MFSFPKTELTIGDLLSVATDLYKQTFRKVWYLSIWMFLPLLIAVFNRHLDYMSVDRANIRQSVYVYMFAILLLFMVVEALVMQRMTSLVSDKKAMLRQTITKVLGKAIPLIFATSIALLFVVVGSAIIVPGIFFAAMFAFITPLILFEHKGIFSSLTASCKMVWGNWWHTMLTIAAAWLVQLLVGYFIMVVLMFFSLDVRIVDAISLVIVQAAVMPWFYAVMLVLYYEVRNRKAA